MRGRTKGASKISNGRSGGFGVESGRGWVGGMFVIPTSLRGWVHVLVIWNGRTEETVHSLVMLM